MKPPYKRKLRNCIRKDTFRYYVEESAIKEIWANIVDYFGPPRTLPEFNLVIIEDERAIIKRGTEEARFTLIKKSRFSKTDDEFIAEITGVSDV